MKNFTSKYIIIALLIFIPAIVAAQVVFPNRGGTGIGTIPSSGEVLVGQGNGTYAPQATSTLGIGGGIWTYTSGTDTLSPILASASNYARITASSFHATSTATSSVFNGLMLTTLDISGDSITDFAGTGLTVTGNALTVDLGTAIVSSEITDNTIQTVDIEATNTEADNDIVTVDTSTGGFSFNTLSELSIQPLDAELTTIAALTETNGAVMFVASGAWTADTTPAINGADFTGIVTAGITDGTILETDLKVVDTPSDEECLTYETTTGDFEWQSCGSGTSLFTDGGATTYLSSTGDDFAIGSSSTSEAAFWVDVSTGITTFASTSGSTGRINIAPSGIGTIALGQAGVTLIDDGDGALTITGVGNGSDENLILNLDDTANTAVWTSGTGLNVWNLSGIDLTIGGGDLTIGSTLVLTGGDTTSLDNIDAINATTETTFESAIDSLANLVLTGALNSGSITSGFGSINNGASAIISTGAIQLTGSLEIPSGAADTVNANGEIAHDTTDNQLIFGASANVLPSVVPIWSFAIGSTSPSFASGTVKQLPRRYDGYTTTSILCDVDGGTSKIIHILGETLTCTVNGAVDDGTIASPTYTALSTTTSLTIGASSGTVDYVNITISGTVTRK